MNKQTLAKTLNNTLKGDVIMKKAGEEILELLGGTGVDFFQQVFEENLEDRRILINDGIDSGVIEKVVMQILKYNKEDKGKDATQRKPIYLLINSLGGDVFNGSNVCDIIQQSKTPVIGVTLSYAMSMSLIILESCHTRIAFKNSVLLLHDGSLTLSNSSKKAKSTMQFYDELDKRVKDLVLEKALITSEQYDEYSEDEYYMFADKAKELGFIDKIVGEDISLEEIL